jgi:hypothetical protein
MMSIVSGKISANFNACQIATFAPMPVGSGELMW